MSPNDDWPYFDEQPHDRQAKARARVAKTPLFDLIGLELDDTSLDFARVSIEAKPDLANPDGITHGGMHATLVDTAVAQAIITTLKPGFGIVTVEMDVKYFKPIAKGRLIAEGRIVRKGRRIVHGEVDLRDDAGNLLGKGWCVYAITQRRGR